MAQRTLQFQRFEDGNLTDVASVELTSPTGTYGVRRTDNQAMVIASGTPMVHASTGTYTFTSPSLDSAVEYDWYAKIADLDGTFEYEPFTEEIATGIASGKYCTSDDIVQKFGLPNVIAWSNTEGDSATEISLARVTLALNVADAEIDNYFRDGPYTVPLSVGSGVATVTEWAVVIAGAWLYNIRGQATEAQAANQYQQELKKVQSQMSLYKGGALRLNAARAPNNVSNAPVAACRVMGGYGM